MKIKNIKQYYRQISRHLSCANRRKKQIIEDIRSGVESFLEENPEADISVVIERFGTPEQITEGYLNEMDTGEMRKCLNTHKRVLGVLITVAAAALAIWLIAVIIASVHEWGTSASYIVVGEINVLEDGETIPPMEVE